MVIYKITNLINNKVYIGQTITTAEQRFKSHVSGSKNAHGGIDSAIKKYGVENFKLEVIDESATTFEELDNLEIYYIAKYDSTNKDKGYNITTGGQGTHGFHHTEESKYKCGSSFRGKPRVKTPGQVEKWRETSIKNGSFIKDEDFCANQSELLKLAYAEGRRKPNPKGVGGRGPMSELEKKLNSERQAGSKKMHNDDLKINVLVRPEEFDHMLSINFSFGNVKEYEYIPRKDYFKHK